MTRPTRFGFGHTIGVTVGGDTDLPEGGTAIECCDVGAVPLDRAAAEDVATAVTLVAAGSPVLENSADATTGFATADWSASFTPTLGNLLVLVGWRRDSGDSADPSGWTRLDDNIGGGSFDDSIIALGKTSDGTETSAVFTWSASGLHYKVMEWSGVSLVDVVANSATSTGTAVTTGSVTPTSGAAAAIIGIASAAGDAVVTYAEGSGYTQLFEDTSGFHPHWHIEYQIVDPTSGSYNPDSTLSASRLWRGITLSLLGSDSTWNGPAPNVNDEDDATYETISGADVLRVDLGGPFVIIRTRLRIATATSGSRSYVIKGANLADFSDEVTLATLAFTATGSYTAQDVTATWVNTTAFQYYELTGNDETRRIHTWELYEAASGLGQDHTHADFAVGDLADVNASTASNGAILAYSDLTETYDTQQNVQLITINDTNVVQGPFVNFAAGSNTTVTVDMFGAAASNTIRIHATGGGSISAGSNSTQVREVSTAGASTTLWSPFDHAHDGIGTITASASNTMQRGAWNLRPGAGIALNLTDTDGDGEFDTTTIVNTGGGGGGYAPSTESAILTSGNITLASNSWTDIISVSLAAGTWLVVAFTNIVSSIVQDSTTRLSDGSATHWASGAQSHPTGYDYTHHLSALIVLTSTTTVKLQGTHNAGGTVTADKAISTNASGDNATQINAVKVA